MIGEKGAAIGGFETEVDAGARGFGAGIENEKGEDTDGFSIGVGEFFGEKGAAIGGFETEVDAGPRGFGTGKEDEKGEDTDGFGIRTVVFGEGPYRFIRKSLF